MRSTKNCNISAGQVTSWALDWLVAAKLLKDHGPKCTAAVVLSVVLRAAARRFSVSAATCDMAGAPSDQAIMTALDAGLPKTLSVLERRLNDALTDHLPRRLRRRSWQLAIDWHLVPYYGKPHKSRNELCGGPRRAGTSTFHTYATACIVSHGQRYTLALSWVRRHESKVQVIERLLQRIDQLGLKIRRLLLDRVFFTFAVVKFLKQKKVPFLMPVMLRGRRPKKGKRKRPAASGLRWIRRQGAGWYRHTMKQKKEEVTMSICVGYRSHRKPKDGKRRSQKLLFAAWGVRGTPTEIRERYRKRFGIETSYRQMREAKIHTCTRKPRLRLLFIAVALLLRNLWVWIHATKLADGPIDKLNLQLHRLRLARMLGWITQEILNRCHDGTTLCTTPSG